MRENENKDFSTPERLQISAVLPRDGGVQVYSHVFLQKVLSAEAAAIEPGPSLLGGRESVPKCRVC